LPSVRAFTVHAEFHSCVRDSAAPSDAWQLLWLQLIETHPRLQTNQDSKSARNRKHYLIG
jgi:hypothetical protein